MTAKLARYGIDWDMETPSRFAGQINQHGVRIYFDGATWRALYSARVGELTTLNFASRDLAMEWFMQMATGQAAERTA